MRAIAHCVNTSRRLLCRILPHPIEQKLLPLSVSVSVLRRARTGPLPSQLRSYVRTPPPNRRPNGQTSASATTKFTDNERGFDPRYTTQADINRSGRDRPPRDHEITDPQIMVIDDGAIEGPLSTSFVLTRIEDHESLRMIKPYVPADPAEDRPECQYAVCKIVNKIDEYERRRELREQKKTSAGKPKTKELELTWSIGAHDLGFKMKQMSGFLTRGCKVEVLVAKKKGGRQADRKEAEAVVARLREEVEENGAREAKPATGSPGGTMRFYLEGKTGR
ncbi:hypothetical protein E4U42_004955 [Claviceps africana]|uniref:Translation initiation factor 3 C-terminal domain-containing protein n=1 Tax=Claviceps africana TaxID=83212 RepID=A0A8K0J5G5_9HYPO|nr:hypothetical protein E4U42_004955 [Claviceps africana]